MKRLIISAIIALSAIFFGSNSVLAYGPVYDSFGTFTTISQSHSCGYNMYHSFTYDYVTARSASTPYTVGASDCRTSIQGSGTYSSGGGSITAYVNAYIYSTIYPGGAYIYPRIKENANGGWCGYDGVSGYPVC